MGVLYILEAIRELNKEKQVKFYQASTSELYGLVQETPQTEKTPFYPRSPYAVAKLYAYWTTVNYRESYNIHASNGILFNHESPRRGPEFVTRKIVQDLIDAYWAKDATTRLRLGNLDALRDWGHAKDYVRAMWLMVQEDKPDDYVIATGEQHSVRKFCELVAEYIGFKIKWEGEGLNEVGRCDDDGRILIEVAEEFYRPAEVQTLLGDSTKAKTKLAWQPEYSFNQLVAEMCEDEYEKAGLNFYEDSLSNWRV
jgi:GDPmannose 4,6-dehydratase